MSKLDDICRVNSFHVEMGDVRLHEFQVHFFGNAVLIRGLLYVCVCGFVSFF